MREITEENPVIVLVEEALHYIKHFDVKCPFTDLDVTLWFTW